MAEGYLSGNKIDVGWWEDQIEAGIAYRKKYAYEDQWDAWRKYYRGEWRPDIQPSNLYFKMLRTVVPRIYFRDPSVSVLPTKPGLQHMIFAKILERVDNRLITKMQIKRHMKRIVHNTFMFGTGFGKLGFGAEFTPTPDDFDTTAPRSKDKSQERFEYNRTVQPNMPWFMSAHTGSIILPAGLDYFDASRWVGHEIHRPKDDVMNDPRLKIQDKKSTTIRTYILQAMNNVVGVSQPIEMVKLYEIRDKKTGRVFIVSPDIGGNAMLNELDSLQSFGKMPIYQSVFNPDDLVAWGVPDSKIIDPIQRELNESNTQIMYHRRLSLRKIFAKRNALNQDAKDAMTSEEINAVIEVDGDPLSDVKTNEGSSIPDDLFKAQEFTRMDGREIVGFSRNEFGETGSSSSRTTATESKIVKMASEIRVDERRDMLADMLTDIINDVNHVIFDQWSDEQVVDIMGPKGVPVWISFKGEMLRSSQYEIKIDPDTGINESKQAREARAGQMYGLLKDDPMINQPMLRKYLMNEMHGTAFDDMLMIPDAMIASNSQNNPLPMAEVMKLFGAGGGVAPGPTAVPNAGGGA